jgi:anti-anti-sigma factor
MTDPHRLTLEGDMTIYFAADLKGQLLSALEAAPRELELDLSQVGEMDTSGCQLLILAKREAARRNKSLRLSAHSASVREVLDFLNIVAYFGDPLVIPASEGA